jgi:hypothetical protein
MSEDRDLRLSQLHPLIRRQFIETPAAAGFSKPNNVKLRIITIAHPEAAISPHKCLFTI